MIIFPSDETTLQNMLTRMVNTAGVTAVSPGSIARSFLEVINTELQSCYKTFDSYMSQCFLSTATGEYLDKIGILVNCKRLAGETDSNYRYRISQQSFSNSKVTLTAIRLACLSINDVVDVQIEKFSHGVGSFTVFVYTNSGVASDALVAKVQAVLDEYAAPGIQAIAAAPTPLKLAFTIYVGLQNDKAAIQIDSLKNEVTLRIKSLVDDIPMGGSLDPSSVLSQVTSSSNVRTAAINSIYINGEKMSGVYTVSAKWNEKMIIDSINYII